MECLVTGASRGIGWAVAQKLALAGNSVTLCARNVDLLKERLRDLPVVSNNQHHSIWSVDFSKRDANLTPARPVDVLVNCAGVANMGLLASQPVNAIDEEILVNFTAPIMLSKAVVRSMLKEGKGGHIIYITSVLGFKGNAGSSVYSATKAGLDGFVRSLAREVGRKGIRVNSVAPGLVDTDMGASVSQDFLKTNIFHEILSPDAVADTVMYLVDHKNLTGVTEIVDNGFLA